jgi:hypothetical protein
MRKQRNPEPGPQPDPLLRTNVRSAAWNAVIALAIVFIMFVTFYGINSGQQTASAPPVAATPADTAGTTGQGGADGQGKQEPAAPNNADQQNKQGEK